MYSLRGFLPLACAEFLAAMEETGPYAAHCHQSHPSGEIGSDFGGPVSIPHRKRHGNQKVCPKSFLQSSSPLLIVAIAFKGIYPSRKPEQNNRSGEILVPWGLFTKLKHWYNLLNKSCWPRDIWLQINLVYNKISFFQNSLRDHEEIELDHLNSGLKFLKRYQFKSSGVSLLPSPPCNSKQQQHLQ